MALLELLLRWLGVAEEVIADIIALLKAHTSPTAPVQAKAPAKK